MLQSPMFLIFIYSLILSFVFFFLVLKLTQQLIIYSEEAAMEKPINKQQKPNPNGVYHLEQITQINYAQ